MFSDPSVLNIFIKDVETELDGIYIDACDVSVPVLSITPICCVFSIG